MFGNERRKKSFSRIFKGYRRIEICYENWVTEFAIAFWFLSDRFLIQNLCFEYSSYGKEEI